MQKVRMVCLIVCLFAVSMLLACGDPSDPSVAPVTTDRPVVSETPVNVAVVVLTAAPKTPKPAETVTLFGEAFPSDAEALVLSEPIEDLSLLRTALPAFSQCRFVELTRSFVSSQGKGLCAFEKEWNDLLTQFPDIAFTGRLLIDGTPAETVQTYSVLTAENAEEEIRAALRCCPALQSIDLSETTVARDVVAAAAKEASSVQFRWKDEDFGVSVSDAESLSFSGEQDAESLAAYLDCFPNLKEVDLRETTVSEEQANALCERFPDVAFRRMILLNKTPTDSFSETLDFSSAKIASYEAFSDALSGFPKLKRLEMHECNLSDEQLAAIRDRYPNVKVVWTVRVKGRRVRTDAIAFSSKQLKNNTNRFKSENAAALQYCTDLIALDLGHNDLTDIEWIRPLKNLQVLILADNRRLSDISPLAELKNLKYIELFLTNVSDLSPLADHDALLDVNLCFSKITDISPLLSCAKLERIWLGGKTAADIGTDGVQALLNAFPNAQYDLTSTSTSTGAGWREHPRYDAYIQMFKTNEPVDPFVP